MKYSLLVAVALGLCLSLAAADPSPCYTTFDEETCLIHLKEHNCKWAPYEHMCLPPSGLRPCSHLTERSDCEAREGCVFDEDYHTCHYKDEPVNCYLILNREDCVAVKDCRYSERGMCIPGGAKAECFAFSSEKDCLSVSHCKWHGTTCLKTTDDRCSFQFSEADCGKQDDCEWRLGANICVTKGRKLLCEAYSSEGPCLTTGYCSWLHHSCRHKDLPFGCHKIYDSAACDGSNDCQWVPGATLCIQKGGSVPCDRFYDRKSCNDSPQCEFDEHAVYCKSKGKVTPCSRYFNEQTCIDAGCEFHQHRCLQPGVRKPCAQYKSSQGCTMNSCFWHWKENTCAETMPTYAHEPVGNTMFTASQPPINPGTHGVSTGHGAGTGNTFVPPKAPLPPVDCSDAKCPRAPACGEGEHIAVHTRECCQRCSLSNEECGKFFDPNSCPDKCQWHDSLYTCTALGEQPACSRVFDELTCSTRQDCTWHGEAFSCTKKGEKPSCDRFYNEPSCHKNGCIFNNDAFACHSADKPLSCDRFFSEESCKKYSNCEYDKYAMACKNAGEVLKCDRYYDKTGCAAQGERCFFAMGGSRCLDAGVTPPCDIYDEVGCLKQERCEWAAAHMLCVDKHDFLPMPCHEHYEANDCNSHETGKCKWDPHAMVCFHVDEAIPCSRFFDEKGCTNNPDCSWRSEVFRCMHKDETVPCSSFYDMESCAAKGCEWHADSYYCGEKGEPLPCERNFDSTRCIAQKGCEWDTESFLCHGDLKDTSCTKLFSRSICMKRNDCKFLQHAYRCVDRDAVLPCEEFIDERSCDSHGVDCQWNTRARTCTVKNKPLNCSKVYDQTVCRDTPHCGWDVRRAKCRHVRQREDL